MIFETRCGREAAPGPHPMKIYLLIFVTEASFASCERLCLVPGVSRWEASHHALQGHAWTLEAFIPKGNTT